MCMYVKSFCGCSVSFLFLSLCSVVHYACDCSCTSTQYVPVDLTLKKNHW